MRFAKGVDLLIHAVPGLPYPAQLLDLPAQFTMQRVLDYDRGHVFQVAA